MVDSGGSEKEYIPAVRIVSAYRYIHTYVRLPPPALLSVTCGGASRDHSSHQTVRDAAHAELPEVHDVAGEGARLVAENMRHL